ncbi:GNAT family N-acetyltransferase [Blastococcus goldschmidtiae]|uniref:GNAT family N-acetyltransferase n=1 Tax=Blastococcus goldschmidtiae TaxID=3075546 RepID=A0ABU2KBM2_9ACTN|nr:GNAT family N-acetyltransferase [Blastococcus sp. DSM 46792]MDT0277572.1 GNAT family N-acetyltransferase [Blastococcus sp. DSM 46792]
MRVRLVPVEDAALAAAARALCAAPVDPPGIPDHDWLHGDPGEVLRRLRLARDRRLAAGGRAWTIGADGAVVGYLSASIDDGGARAETFSVVARAEQGRGIGFAARRLALDELAAAGIRSVVSLARPGSASAAVSRRLGYRLTGTEERTHPDGYVVALERYELRLPRGDARMIGG